MSSVSPYKLGWRIEETLRLRRPRPHLERAPPRRVRVPVLPDHGSASLPAFLAAGTFFASHVVDVLLVVSAGALLVNGRLPFRLLAYGAFLVQFLGDALQLFSHYLTGQYLSRLAVENANHVTLLFSPRRVTAAAVAVAAALSVPLLTESARKAVRWREAGTLSLAALSLAAVVAVAPGAFRRTPAGSARSCTRGTTSRTDRPSSP